VRQGRLARPLWVASALTGLLGLPGAAAPAPVQTAAVQADQLDALFDDPVLARALVAVRIDRLADAATGYPGAVLYRRNPGKLVMPGSNMKLLTLAVAADRLGWDYRYETRLESAGSVRNGTLQGDLVVVGGGDPSIVAQDGGPAPLFAETADALWTSGVRRVDGRLVGDDGRFDQAGWGAGWSWDYLDAGYAAPSGALSYNENTVLVRVVAGARPGDVATVELTPPGHPFVLHNLVTTGPAGSDVTVTVTRPPGSVELTVHGSIPAGGDPVLRTAAIDQPTRFFLEGLRAALIARGIPVGGPSVRLSDLTDPPAGPRRVLATRQSLPLSALAGYFIKVSQNFYADMLLKTLGQEAGSAGSIVEGRRVVHDTLVSWGAAPDAFVMDDGSGLSRLDYVTADTVVTVLTHAWMDERLRGPFVAALPVGGKDGTLAARMKGTILEGRVEAKTGTIANVRALSGYLETVGGDHIVFSIIANNFTAQASAVDRIVEAALAAVAARQEAQRLALRPLHSGPWLWLTSGPPTRGASKSTHPRP
jgi:D-alanyl-D-alanine carboxypeptidase/D-alanyl-D-alanine-endopeptidase (penicillin-binding protein 4)